MNKLAIVDGDALLYHSSKETLEESIESLNDRLQNIFIKTEATHYVIFISFSPYFRHKIDPLYKSNRGKYSSALKWLKTLKSYLIENWNAQSMKQVEADDLCAYWMNQTLSLNTENELFDIKNMFHTLSEPIDKILCAVDKDLLKSIPGKHFNYSYKSEGKDVIKGWWIETTDVESNYFKLKQIISGDASDGIKTPFPENAGEWFVQNKMNFNDVVSAYILGFNYETPTGIKKYIKGLGTSKGLFELSKNYRLLHMLDCDEDFMREVEELPEFPKITPVSLSKEVILTF